MVLKKGSGKDEPILNSTLHVKTFGILPLMLALRNWIEKYIFNPLMLGLAWHLTKLSILKYEGIAKKIFYERCVYQSVDDNRLCQVI